MVEVKNKQISILLVDDEPTFGSLLRQSLEISGYNVEHVLDPEKALNIYKNGHYDVCLLDIMMPKKDGYSLAEDLKKINPDVFVIFITAKEKLEDEKHGYKVGAYDYIRKPLDVEILQYKINNWLGRGKSSPVSPNAPLAEPEKHEEERRFKIGNSYFDSRLRTLTLKGKKPKRLSPKESDLFKLLCLNVNDLTLRKDALKKIWGDPYEMKEYSEGISRSIDVYINKLRGYYKDDPYVRIENIHGTGFTLVVEDLNQGEAIVNQSMAELN